MQITWVCSNSDLHAMQVISNAWSGSQGIEELLTDLCNLGFLRNNLAHCTWGMPPAIRGLLQAEARSSAPEMYESAIVAFVENCLRLAESASALTAAKAQVSCVPAPITITQCAAQVRKEVTEAKQRVCTSWVSVRMYSGSDDGKCRWRQCGPLTESAPCLTSW